MDLKLLITVFAAVFMAELGDKTQLATMLFASDKGADKMAVFAGSALALVASSAAGVLAGGVFSQYISQRQLHYIAGTGFVAIGLWTLFRA